MTTRRILKKRDLRWCAGQYREQAGWDGEVLGWHRARRRAREQWRRSRLEARWCFEEAARRPPPSRLWPWKADDALTATETFVVHDVLSRGGR